MTLCAIFLDKVCCSIVEERKRPLRMKAHFKLMPCSRVIACFDKPYPNLTLADGTEDCILLA